MLPDSITDGFFDVCLQRRLRDQSGDETGEHIAAAGSAQTGVAGGYVPAAVVRVSTQVRNRTAAARDITVTGSLTHPGAPATALAFGAVHLGPGQTGQVATTVTVLCLVLLARFVSGLQGNLLLTAADTDLRDHLGTASAQVSAESRELGWFYPDALPTPLAHATEGLVAPALERFRR